MALAPAKLNLFLEVLAKRSDGYHEIESLMVTIDLCDVLFFTPDPTGRISLQVDARSIGPSTASGPESLPADDENLVVRAVRLLQERADVSAGARLRLVKKIPIAAGLGGGSSDAAAALRLANDGWKLDWPEDRLLQLAAELGSDVPFFLGQGAAVCTGRGERIQRVAGIRNLHFVLVRPPEGLATARVYARATPNASPLSSWPLVRALQQGRWRQARKLFTNRLEEAAAGLSPWIERLGREFAALDCTVAQMSGSGTSYFGLCRHAGHARRLAGALRARGVGRVLAVRC
jgi:4-diphosphocytidyl-2-C-methyl-D-erythritol kinase